MKTFKVLFMAIMFAMVISGYAQAESFTFQFQIGSTGSGDGQFLYPVQAAVDPVGNVYIVDSGNGRIQKFNSNGEFITKWGSWGSGDGQFAFLSSLVALAVDSMGNVYVADWARIQKFNSDGVFIKSWGSYGNGPAQFAGYIHGITVDRKNNWVYVSDSANQRIQKFDTNGTFLTMWGSLGAADGQFVFPTGLAVDSLGMVYVGDPGGLSASGPPIPYLRGQYVIKFDSNGNFISKWTNAGFSVNNPRQIAIDPLDKLYIAEDGTNRVEKFTTDGTLIPTPGLAGTDWAVNWGPDGPPYYPYFQNPMGVAVHPSGRVYVTDLMGGRVVAYQSSIFLPEYSCVGFQSPADKGAITVKKDRAIPLKAEVFDKDFMAVVGGDPDFQDPPVINVSYKPEIGSAIDVTAEALSAGAGTVGNQFEFLNGLWQYNLKTSNYSSPGTYTVIMAPGNATYSINNTCTATFVIK